METDTIFDFYTDSFELPDGSYVNCEIMDTGGQEEFDSQNRLYYKRADCCLLVYDITNKNSFNSVKNFYIKEISNNCIKDIKVILLGNKTDLKNQRKISHKDGANLASKHKFIFMETSCEENYNVRDAFETIILMTNNEMIRTGKLNESKSEDKVGLINEEENNEIFIINDDNLKKDIKKKKKKNKKNCC